MDSLTSNIVALAVFLGLMPVAAFIAVKVIRRRGGATTRSVTKGAGDVSAPEWLSQVVSAPVGESASENTFPLLVNDGDFEQVTDMELDPHDTGTGVFGQALRPAVLPTAPPPAKKPTETESHE